MEMAMDVPYRCPRCGGSRTFSTLAELKAHMAEDHAYFAQRRRRLRIFDYSPPQTLTGSGRHSPLLQSFLDESQRLEEEVKLAKQEELNNQLQRQKKALSRPPSSAVSSNHATKSRAAPKKLKVNFRTPPRSQEPDTYLQDSLSHLNHEVLVQRHQNWRTADALYSTQDVLSGVEEAAEDRVSEQKNFISELTRQLAEKERQILSLRTQLETAKDKEKENEKDEDETESHKTSSGSLPAVDNIGRERQSIEDELQKKKLELENLNKQLASARQTDNRKREVVPSRRKHDPVPDKNRERREMDRTKRDNHSADISSQNSELSDYSTAGASATVSRTSSSSVKARSNHLRKPKHNLPTRNPDPHPVSLPHRHNHHLNNKLRQDDHHRQPPYTDRLRSQKLKEERQLLIQQMKDLLSKANTDNEKLKDELVAKETHLRFLNQELERTKTDQSELMEETYDLYKEAEKSLAKLKERLKTKETELDQANSRLEDIRHAHERLVSEKDTVVKTADDKDVLYQNMMRDRDQEIQSLKGLLESQQEEREKLKRKAEELKDQIVNKEKTQEHLSQAIASKEEELAKAKEDVDALSKFLQTAAAKESVARSKLEAFVTELIDRADRAEKELKHLRGLESSSSGNLTSDPSLAGGIPSTNVKNVNAVPGQSGRSQAAAPLHSTPETAQNGRHVRSSQLDAGHLLQASLEPWYNDLGAASLPNATPLPSSGLGPAPNTPHGTAGFVATGVSPHPPPVSAQPAQVPLVAGYSQQQPQTVAQGQPFLSQHAQQVQHLPGPSLSSQQLQQPVHPAQGQQLIPTESYQLASQGNPPMAPQQAQLLAPLQSDQAHLQQTQPMPPQQNQQIHSSLQNQYVSPQQTQPVTPQHTQQVVPQGSQQIHPLQNQHITPQQSQPLSPQSAHQLPLQQTQAMISQQNQPLPSHQQLSSQHQAHHLPSQHPQQLQGHQNPQAPHAPVQQMSSQLSQPPPARHGFPQPPSGQNNHPQHHMQQRPVSQSGVQHQNRSRRNTNPFVEVYTIQPREDLHSPTGVPVNHHGQSRNREHSHRSSVHSPQSLGDSEREDSSVYAPLPSQWRRGRIDSNPFRNSAVLSRQAVAYDGGDEQAYSDSQEGHSRDGMSENSHNFMVNSSGKVLHKENFKSVPSNPFRGGANNSWTPESAYKSNLFSGSDAVDGKGYDPHRGANKPFSPDRTYPIYCVTGREARDLPWEDASDSNYSHQDTPHFNVAVIDRKPRGKGKVKAFGNQQTNMYPRKLYRYRDDSSTDGLELSVDENGILWEVADSASEVSESYRMSPYGSETAGDVDTSVLMSSQPANNKRVVHGQQDTDDDVDSFDEDGILKTSENGVLRASGRRLPPEDGIFHPSEDGILRTSDEGILELSEDDLDVQKPPVKTEECHLPLGERITRILKTVGRDEDSESLEELMKQNKNNTGRGRLADSSATTLYGTDRRVPRAKTESPLERALAVQNRVKSLTYPRTRKKYVTISDTSSSSSKANHLVQNGTESGRKPLAKQRATAKDKQNPTTVKPEESLMQDLLGDFSSSSYASIPPASVPKPADRKIIGKILDNSTKPSNAEVQHHQLEAKKQNGVAATSQEKATSDRKAVSSSERNGDDLKAASKTPSNNAPMSSDLRSKRPQMDGKEKEAESARPAGHGANHTRSENGSTSVAGNSPPVGQNSSQSLKPQEVISASHAKSRKVTEAIPDTASTIKRQPSNNTRLNRQDSVSAEELELQKFADSPPKPARQPTARSSQFHSQSSLQSSENESVCPSPPLALPPSPPQGERRR